MRKIKLWIELLFIFLIPLILMILCLEFKTINTYDENNNIITSEKVLDIKELDFINNEEKTYERITYEIINDDTNVNKDYYLSLNSLMFNKNGVILLNNETQNNIEYTKYRHLFIYTPSTQTSIWTSQSTEINNTSYYVANDEFLRLVLFDSLNDNFTKNYRVILGSQMDAMPYKLVDLQTSELIARGGLGLSFTDNTSNLTNVDIIRIKDEQIDDCYIKIPFTDNQMQEGNYYYGVYKNTHYTQNNKEYYSVLNIHKEYKTLKENAISKLLNLLYDNLGIQQNIIIQLITIYTILWFTMFLLWHLIYLPFNCLLHIADRKKE